MAKEDRLELIRKFQEVRQSKVILFILGDRQPEQLFRTIVAPDSVGLLQKILRGQKGLKKISIVIHSTGGDINTPWPFVNLVREYTSDFEVIIPRRALSAATLICLGAERIVMSAFSHLSAIDPQAKFRMADGKSEDVAIEDIVSFIDFSKKKIGLKDRAGRVEILKALQKIDAKFLGNIHRTHTLIRKLASGLLRLRNTSKLSERKIKSIVTNLTEKTYSHTHFIGRNEAKKDIEMGRMIEYADDSTFDLMEKIFDQIEKDLQLNEPLDVQGELEKSAPSQAKIPSVRCIMQSEDRNFEGKSDIIILANGQIPPPSFKWHEV